MSVDLAKPETFIPSDEAYEIYRKDDMCIRNHIARENPNEPFLETLSRHKGFEEIVIEGKGIHEFIRDLQ
jgi:hypothetical protein